MVEVSPYTPSGRVRAVQLRPSLDETRGRPAHHSPVHPCGPPDRWLRRARAQTLPTAVQAASMSRHRSMRGDAPPSLAVVNLRHHEQTRRLTSGPGPVGVPADRPRSPTSGDRRSSATCPDRRFRRQPSRQHHGQPTAGERSGSIYVENGWVGRERPADRVLRGAPTGSPLATHSPRKPPPMRATKRALGRQHVAIPSHQSRSRTPPRPKQSARCQPGCAALQSGPRAADGKDDCRRYRDSRSASRKRASWTPYCPPADPAPRLLPHRAPYHR